MWLRKVDRHKPGGIGFDLIDRKKRQRAGAVQDALRGSSVRS
jgi:hypothetical protein